MRWLILLLPLIPLLPASATETKFPTGLYPIFKQAACRSCHYADGVASATRLHFPEPEAAPDRVEAFGRSLVALVNREQPEKSLLLTKPTNQIAHVGGEKIKPGSREEGVLKAWIAELVKMSGAERAAALKYKEEASPGAAFKGPVLRRLTHSQYNNTVRDLLGELSQPATQFPPEDFVNGFKNQYDTQSLSPMLYEYYSAAAEKIARNAFRRGNTESLIGCKPAKACGPEFVRSFGMKAFRRPLNAKEQSRYEALLAEETDFLKGAQTVVEAMLQSPHFLFHLDETSDPGLRPYAAASRLSYSLWNTTPDTALLKSAAAGELSTPEGLRSVVQKMLADPRAKEALDEFVSQWMRFDRVITAGKDRRKYPKFSRETAVAMTEETRRFVADLVWEDRNFMELFTSEFGFVNAELAGLYGLPAPQKDFEKVRFPAESERAGLLGQALFLTSTSTPNDTSPTSRGLFVREQFLCQHVADPPPGVSTDLPPLSESKPQTNRERLAIHVSDKTCASCHSLVDPIGFGLEKFDAIGTRREMAKLIFFPLDRKSKEKPKTVELPLDTSGSVAGIKDSNFSSPRELGGILARTVECQECIVKQYFRYVTGRAETISDRPLIRKVFEDFRNSQFRFKELMTSLVVAREFSSSPGGVDLSRLIAPPAGGQK